MIQIAEGANPSLQVYQEKLKRNRQKPRGIVFYPCNAFQGSIKCSNWTYSEMQIHKLKLGNSNKAYSEIERY